MRFRGRSYLDRNKILRHEPMQQKASVARKSTAVELNQSLGDQQLKLSIVREIAQNNRCGMLWRTLRPAHDVGKKLSPQKP